MDDLRDIINELPPELNDGSAPANTRAAAPVLEDEEEVDTTQDQEEEQEVDADEEVEDQDTNDETEEEGENESTDEEDDNQDEYVVDPDEEEDDTPPASNSPAIDTTKITQDEFVLAGLTKLTVRVVGEDDKIYTVQAYGNGDLPRDMKDFASKYEEKVWDAQVINQEAKARELIQKYQDAKSSAELKSEGDRWVRLENMAIREDLNDLIREGVFPKFKGEPGSKEFEESPGGKEFTKVINFMQEQNEKYRVAGNSGKAYRHIGLREAFVMLNGPNPKAAEKAEDKARKVVAKKLRSGGGTKNNSRNISTKPVSNLNDLVDEFSAFSGSTR